MIEVLAPAKINLFLRVCGKNNLGLHLLDSLVAFTEFGDQLTIEPANEDRFTLVGDFSGVIKVSTKNNLVMRALNAFRDAGGAFVQSHITLKKKIPVGAGLGGGSTDAAALLRALNKHSPKPLEEKQLYDIAVTLGADVPVCLAGGCQRISSIGEILTPHVLPEIGAILLANPKIPLSTEDVFSSFTGPFSGYAGSLEMFDTTSLVRLGNDLTATAITLLPEVGLCLDRLMAADGIITASMSGSGGSCFAFFVNKTKANEAEHHMKAAGFWTQVSRIRHPQKST
ncbi:4-(cytidine 5'-diphospho)-2-C-methyl-D-erythritol kinase [Candidatus Puniceispirillum sp.]|nr:4-(cytidine 5'-diphospho)-2-C-methyl-D-erythritol kinase [Candidatus Puniceispirillum sp.]